MSPYALNKDSLPFVHTVPEHWMVSLVNIPTASIPAHCDRALDIFIGQNPNSINLCILWDNIDWFHWSISKQYHLPYYVTALHSFISQYPNDNNPRILWDSFEWFHWSIKQYPNSVNLCILGDSIGLLHWSKSQQHWSPHTVLQLWMVSFVKIPIASIPVYCATALDGFIGQYPSSINPRIVCNSIG